MSFTDENIICPYPGLRPFREDESIFLRGRDEHVEQITRQLEQKKFLMLTGASGDGKSSLVYAGLIPNARAGFFKAKFNNWQVVDFRPERAPLQNLEDALAERFSGDVRERFRRELKFGFSSLVDIYTDSPHYVDKTSSAFLELSEQDQRKAIRRGSNLMILVDQFEEFFTNPENYQSGKASPDSQLVMSMLLETCRLATERDLPIYVVCTMRSDYIGQCAAFRGLPEAIGYSQFFVPRLKRKEIYQVIEEPAHLNGNKISKRLVEMLLHQMGEGIDQLPVLQHALNQIWLEADKGKEEMDLIHFARAGGIDVSYLPEKSREDFLAWKQALAPERKPFFENPSLDNVLDRHANDLYYQAFDYFKQLHPDSMLTQQQAGIIIETTFRSLTKIDAARSVRNRMTMQEITSILQIPGVGLKEVSGVLEIFRLSGNTFLKPFFEPDECPAQEQGEWVMDITHESLIRNWGRLREWALAEEADHQTWLDFEKQLRRWTDNGRIKGYLLPIGSLNFFETWFATRQPNEYWLMKFDERDVTAEEKLQTARKTLSDARRFIRASIGNLFFSRFVLKHGAQKVALWACLLVLAACCEYFRRDYLYKTNERVLGRCETEGMELLGSKRVDAYTKAEFIVAYESLHPGKLEDLIRRCGNDSIQANVVAEIPQIYLPDDIAAIENFHSVKPEIENQLFRAYKGFVSRQSKATEVGADSTRLTAARRLLKVAEQMPSIHAKMGYLSDSLRSCNEKMLSVIWQELVQKNLRTGGKNEAPYMIQATDLAIANRISRDSIRRVIREVAPFCTDTSQVGLLAEVPAQERLHWLAGLYAYCGDADACVNTLSQCNVELQKEEDYTTVVAAAWLGHRDSCQIPEVVLKVKTLLQAQNSQNGKTPPDITALSLGMLADGIKSTGGRIDKTVSDYNYGRSTMLLSALMASSVATICNAFQCHLEHAGAESHSGLTTPKQLTHPHDYAAERLFWKAQAKKLWMEYLSLHGDSIAYEQVWNEFIEDVNSLPTEFFRSKVDIAHYGNNYQLSPAMLLLAPFFKDIHIRSYGYSMHFQLRQYDACNLSLRRMLTSQWAMNYEWSADDLEEMQKWLKGFYVFFGEFTQPYHRIMDTKDIFLFYDFIDKRLPAEAKDREFQLMGALLKYHCSDSLDQIASQQRLLPFNESDLFETGSFSSSAVLLRYLEGGIAGNDRKGCNLFRSLRRSHLLHLLKSGQGDQLLTRLKTDDELQRDLLFLIEQSCLNDMPLDALKLLKRYLEIYPNQKSHSGKFYRLASRLGGNTLIQYAKSSLANEIEENKFGKTRFFLEGYMQAGKYYEAHQCIPEEYSANSKLTMHTLVLMASLPPDKVRHYNSHREPFYL